MDKNYNLVDALRVLLKWKWPIAGFVFITTVGAIVVTLMMDNYYESKAVFFPTNPNRTERQALFSKEGSEMGSDFFGSKNDVNRFLSIANSAPLVDFLVNYYNLAIHYEYDTADTKFKRYKVTEEFKDNYSAIKTEHGAIEITIMDTDAQLAAEMVNMVLTFLDDYNKKNIQQSKKQVLAMFQQTLTEKQKEVDALTDTLAFLKREYSIQESGNPGEEGSTYLVTGTDPVKTEVFKVLRSKQVNAIKDLNEVKSLYDQNLAASADEVSSIFVVEQAYPSEKKAKPKRSVIVIGVFLIAIFLGVAGALLIDRLKQLKAELDNAE